MIKRTTKTYIFWFIVLGLSPVAAFAHVEDSQAGFLSGFLHPVFGLDHFLAMLSVGIISAQAGGKSVYQVPIIFVLFMIVGATLGLLKYSLPMMEESIAISVILLGISIVLTKQDRLITIIAVFVAFFGFLHGYAHGLEMPNSADPVFYGGGFLISTVIIHLIGVAIGHYLTVNKKLSFALRYAGSAMAGVGAIILLNIVTG